VTVGKLPAGQRGVKHQGTGFIRGGVVVVDKRKMEGAALRRAILCELRVGGLVARPSAVHALESVLRREEDARASLLLFMTALKTRSRAGEAVDVELVRAVTLELTQNDDDAAKSAINIVAATDMPEFRWNNSRKSFFLVEKTQKDAVQLVTVLRERLHVVQQRLLRNPAFVPPVLGPSPAAHVAGGSHRIHGSPQQQHIELTQIESLVAQQNGHQTQCALGIISRLGDGKLYLEDLHGKVQLDIRRANFSPGIVTEGSIVLVEGQLVDEVFEAINVGGPPCEDRQKSLLAHGGLDMLVGGDPIPQSTLNSLLSLEKAADDVSFLVLSDVFLDDPKVLKNLRNILEVFSTNPELEIPKLFAFTGNFCSIPFGEGKGQCGASAYAELLTNFGSLLADFPRILNESEILVIPGPEDPGPTSNVLPRHPIPKFYRKDMMNVLHEACENVRITFSTNPCRVRFYTQQIVFYRDEIVNKMRRFAIQPPDEEKFDIADHLARTMLQQAHLCPLPFQAKPVLWQYDGALRLYPAPHIVFACQSSAQSRAEYNGCQVFNPGSFSMDYSFMLYMPASKYADFSKVVQTGAEKEEEE